MQFRKVSVFYGRASMNHFVADEATFLQRRDGSGFDWKAVNTANRKVYSIVQHNLYSREHNTNELRM